MRPKENTNINEHDSSQVLFRLEKNSSFVVPFSRTNGRFGIFGSELRMFSFTSSQRAMDIQSAMRFRALTPR